MRPFWFLLIVFPSVVTAGSPGPLMARGDSAFQRIDYEAARTFYEQAHEAAPEDTEVLWRLARLEVCVGDMQRRDDRRPYYDRAERYARASIAGDSTLAVGHTWLAAALGNLAMYGGSEEKVRLSREIKQELDRALALDPRDDVAWSILGTFYRALGRISWIERQLAEIFLGGVPPGGDEESEQALKTAIQLAPSVIRHHFELGRLYAEMGREEEAAEAFARVLELPPMLGSDRWKQRRAAEWLEPSAAE